MMDTTAAEQAAHAVVSAPPRLHLGFLDGLRALAALYVMLYHALLTIWAYDRPTGILYALTEWLRYGHFAVCLFIVISGFCLMLPVVRGNGALPGGGAVFFRKRARRILPPYYITLAGSLLLATTILRQKTGATWDESLPVTAGGVLSHLFLIHNAFNSWKFQINGVLWSVAVECQLYLLMPMLVKLWAKWGGLKVTTLTLAISFGGYLALWHTPYAGLMPHFLGLFAMGMLGAAVCFSGAKPYVLLRQRVAWGWAAALLWSLLAAFCWRWGKQHPGGLADYLAGLASAALIVAAARPEQKRLQRFLAWPPLVRIGVFSYSLYLIHAPLLQIIWQYGLIPLHLNRAAGFVALTLTAAPASVGLAYLFFLACERPFLSSRPVGA